MGQVLLLALSIAVVILLTDKLVGDLIRARCSMTFKLMSREIHLRLEPSFGIKITIAPSSVRKAG